MSAETSLPPHLWITLCTFGVIGASLGGMTISLEVRRLLQRAGHPSERPFTAEQIGASHQRLSELVSEGQLRRVVRGVYLDNAVRDTLTTRARALALVVPSMAVVTDRTAAWLHGVDVLLPGEDKLVPKVHVFDRRVGSRVRRGAANSGQRTMPDSDVMRVGGVAVTTPLRTAIDLGRQRWPDQAFAQAEAMVRAGVGVDEILRELPRFAGYRWIRQFREIAPLLDPRPQSVRESVMRFRWLSTGQPAPEPQRPVIGPQGQTWWLDLGVDELYFAVEYDGREFHKGWANEEHDRKRRSWIEEHTPWTVKVICDENLFGADADFEMALPAWIREARRTLPERLRRGRRWYDAVGD